MAATSNVSLTAAWAKVTTDSSSDFLASSHGTGDVEFAVTATDVTPTVSRGHVLQAGDALTRTVTGTGFVWARVTGYPAKAVLVVTK